MIFFVASVEVKNQPNTWSSFLNLKHLKIWMAESLCLAMPTQNSIFLYCEWISNKMQITACKKSTKSLNIFQRYWWFVISENFGYYNPLKWHDNTVASIDVYLHATNKQNNSTFPKNIGTLLFWRKFGMPWHAWPNPTNITWFI